MGQPKELVAYIAKALVDSPEEVDVQASAHDDNTLELRVATDDRGKVIGRKGRTAHAIRVLLSAAAEGTSLEIVD